MRVQSTKPGANKRPAASITVLAVAAARSPIAATRSSRMPTSGHGRRGQRGTGKDYLGEDATDSGQHGGMLRRAAACRSNDAEMRSPARDPTTSLADPQHDEASQAESQRCAGVEHRGL